MIAYDPYVPAQRAAELGVTLVDFDTLVRSSDYITLHCPATEDNHHLFSEAVFARMKPTAYLINAARGSIVDETALIAALRAVTNERIAEAAQSMTLDTVYFLTGEDSKDE